MTKKLKAILALLLILSIVAVGVSIGYTEPEVESEKDDAEQGLYDPDIHVNVLEEPNLFPNLMGIYDATVGGVTYGGAVVTMVAGRLRIQTEGIRMDTGEAESLPSGKSFFCVLDTEMYLRGGYTYYGYYRTEDGPFKRLPRQSDMAPITLDLMENGEGAIRGSLSQGLTVSEDTSATLVLRNCYNGNVPYYECGQYQFHIIAVPK